MKRFQLKYRRGRTNAKLNIPYAVAAGAFLALIIALCVVSASRARTVSQLNMTKENMTLSVRGDLTSLMRAYDRMALPGVNVEKEVLPGMRLNLYGAATMNKVLIEVYGKSGAVLGEDLIHELELMVDGVDQAIERGQSLSEVREALGQTIGRIQLVLSERFGADDSLMPVTALN